MMKPLLSILFPVLVMGAAHSRQDGDAVKLKGFLGVGLSDLKEDERADLKIEGGGRVDRVIPGSPADRAGLRQGDILLTIDGATVPTSQKFPALIGEKEPGASMAVEFLRDGKRKSVRVILDFRPGEAPPGHEIRRCEKLLADCSFDLSAAIGKALKESAGETVLKARLEDREGKAVYRCEVAQGHEVVRVILDAKSGAVIDKSTEEGDPGPALESVKIPLAKAIDIARKKSPGQATAARVVLEEEENTPVEVTVLSEKRLRGVRLNGAIGEILDVEVPDLSYIDDASKVADPRKQRLDLYLPASDKPFPIVMWIHAGAWSLGDRSNEAGFGRRLAEQGIGVAAIGYRLSASYWISKGGTLKGVRHPEHIKDCARAFAWLRAHAGEYGGNPERLFISGYSSGGQLSALLALDSKYLDELKVPMEAIKEAVPMDGAYDLERYHDLLTKGENAKLAEDHMKEVWGSDPKAWREASPTTYVKGCKVPMLVLFERGVKAMAEYKEHFREAAEREKVTIIRFLEIEDRNHDSMRFGLDQKGPDTARDAAVDFIRKRCEELDRKSR